MLVASFSSPSSLFLQITQLSTLSVSCYPLSLSLQSSSASSSSLFGLILYILALKIKITKSIIENTLVTHGVYSVVRNPIYSAWLFICTGSLFLAGSFLLAPPLFLLFWLSLTLLMKHTEEKWLAKLYGKTYLDYCKKVNRCLPWSPKKAT